MDSSWFLGLQRLVGLGLWVWLVGLLWIVVQPPPVESSSSSTKTQPQRRRRYLWTWQPPGQSHRLTGAIHYGLLLWGSLIRVLDDHQQHSSLTSSTRKDTASYLVYDILLGLAGIGVTLTAARDFPHVHVLKYKSKKDKDDLNVVNESGTLAQHAMVSQAEMIEHAFYQGLNLWQALYLHWMGQLTMRQMDHDQRNVFSLLALFVVTCPWLVRRFFPVHSFSDNWKRKQHQNELTNGKSETRDGTSVPKKTSLSSETIEVSLYRFKKAQYLIYKHVVFHGVNISQFALKLQHQPVPTTALPLVYSPSWRLFWLCLNTSYVMEFFLQSMVQRHVLTQSQMLHWNRSLMVLSTLAAILVLTTAGNDPPTSLAVLPWICLTSLLLNLVHRHHDVLNTMVLAGLAIYVYR